MMNSSMGLNAKVVQSDIQNSTQCGIQRQLPRDRNGGGSSPGILSCSQEPCGLESLQPFGPQSGWKTEQKVDVLGKTKT